MNNDAYTGTPYDPQDQPMPDNRDRSLFSGESNDPTFTPYGANEPSTLPFDAHFALEGMNALRHPSDITNPAQNPQLPVDNPATTDGTDGTSPKQMTESQLIAVIKQKVESSHQWYGTDSLSTKRIKADQYYRGEPLGNEQDGRSQVVSRDVAESVDSAMPSMMRIFSGGDQVVNFEPNSEEDEDAAKQATDYINHIFMQENEGFMIMYTWFKDGFLKKNGIVKTWHDVRMKRTKENYQGLTQQELQAMQQNPNIQVTNIQPCQESVEQINPQTGQPVQVPTTFYDCVVIETKPEKRIRVMPVPPDEFIIERRAVSLDTCGFCAHRGRRTISDLLECGYDYDKVMSIQPAQGTDINAERNERFNEETYAYDDSTDTDPTMRKVWVTEAYIKCDYDGDGIAEWRAVTLGSDSGINGAVILDNQETDDHAFSDLTPTPECHKFYGLSFFDQANDIQDIKTALLRGILDSTYLSNAPRLGFIEGQANMDDLLDARPGGLVRLKNAGALVPIESTPISEAALSVVNYIDSVKEKRTGVSAASNGLNPNILNSSATGADILNNQNQQRLELIARIYAETGVKRLFRRIFQLTCQYQDVPRTVRLRGKWVTVDPRDWKDRMDVVASVGLGLGTKQQQASVAMQMLDLDKQIVQLQGGQLNGPFLKPEHVYAKLAKLVEAVGWKSPDAYYQNPANSPPPTPQPPTPEQQVHLAQIQADATKAQAQSDAAKADALSDINGAALDYKMKQLDYAIKLVELEALKVSTGQKVAGMANNTNAPSDVMPNFMAHGE